MRAIVVAPVAGYSTYDVASGLLAGLLDNGVEAVWYDYGDRWVWYLDAAIHVEGEVVKQMTKEEAKQLATRDLLASIYIYDPDVVFFVHCGHLDPELIQKVRCKKVLVLTESPYEDKHQYLFSEQVEPDMILLNDPTNGDLFGQVAETFYLPHSYDPRIHHPGSPWYPSDACFVGTLFHNRRVLLEAVDWTGIDLRLGGMLDSLSADSPLLPYVEADILNNEVTASWYRGTKVGLNIYRGDIVVGDGPPDTGWAVGPREVEMAACGTFFIREPRPESDELFPFLPTFESAEELGYLVREWVPRGTERHQLGEQARQAVADRTFKNHASRILRRLAIR